MAHVGPPGVSERRKIAANVGQGTLFYTGAPQESSKCLWRRDTIHTLEAGGLQFSNALILRHMAGKEEASHSTPSRFPSECFPHRTAVRHHGAGLDSKPLSRSRTAGHAARMWVCRQQQRRQSGRPERRDGRRYGPGPSDRCAPAAPPSPWCRRCRSRDRAQGGWLPGGSQSPGT